MQVKKTQYQKITDIDVSKLSTDIKNFVTKMQNEINERNKIINEYTKIINGTKKEYQRLYRENIKYREKIKRQQELDQKMGEKELRMYKTQKQCNIQFTR